MYKCKKCLYECKGLFLMKYHLTEKHGLTWTEANKAILKYAQKIKT